MAESVNLTSINAQEDAVKLSTFPEFQSYQLKSCSYCIDVKLTAPPYTEKGETRAPIDLVAVIDRSGSMIGSKLDLVKKVLHFVVSHLKSFDRLGIVIYDDIVEEIAALTKVTQTNRIELDGKIDKIYGNGSTNLSGGLLKGMLAMKDRSGDHADVASVLLFTDGIANAGISNTNGIVTAMSNLYGEAKNYTVNTFGFGGNHNVEMLKGISETGNGLYYFIEGIEQIPEIFTNCLGGLLSTVAQNISIWIETCNGAVIREIHSKAKPTLSNENKNGKVSMGDLQSEEEHDILVELTLPDIEPCNSPSNYANISLSYLNVIKKNSDNAQAEVSVLRCLEPGAQAPSLEVDEQRNRIKTIESLAKAAEMAEKGRLEEARNILTTNQRMINSSSSHCSPRVMSLNADLTSAMQGFSDKITYSGYGKYLATTLGDSHVSQRSTSMDSPSYSTQFRHDTYHGYENIEPCPPPKPRAMTIPHIPLKNESAQLSSEPALPKRYRNPNDAPIYLEHNEEAPPTLPARSASLPKRKTLKENPEPTDLSKGPPFISEL